MLGEAETITIRVIVSAHIAPPVRVALLAPTVAQGRVVAEEVRVEEVPAVVVAVVEKIIRILTPPLVITVSSLCQLCVI
jgi:hypothetical protein